MQLEARVAELEAEAKTLAAGVAETEQALAESVRVAEDAAAKAAEECAGLRTRIAEQDTAATKYEYAVRLWSKDTNE